MAHLVKYPLQYVGINVSTHNSTVDNYEKKNRGFRITAIIQKTKQNVREWYIVAWRTVSRVIFQ